MFDWVMMEFLIAAAPDVCCFFQSHFFMAILNFIQLSKGFLFSGLDFSFDPAG
jgi:hypothetical protein